MCEKLQNALAEHGPSALPVDDASKAQVRQCGACRAFIEALDEITAVLTRMPVHDAPQPVVERVLAATRGRGTLDRHATRIGSVDRDAADNRDPRGGSNHMQS